MAVISESELFVNEEHGLDRDALVVSWTPLANGDSGSPVNHTWGVRRSVQVSGTFGVGGTVVLEGSNDGTNYHTLKDEAGNNISLGAAGLVSVRELTKYVRPRVSAGDTATSLRVDLLVAK